jgi:hypothetical protein
MKKLGQNYIIAKCASGNGKVDAMWESHYKNGIDAGISMIPYTWIDPIEDAITQAKFFLKTLENKKIPCIVIDFEQAWNDWNLWEQNLKDESIVVPIFPKEYLFNHFKTVYEYLTKNTVLPIIVYTANWFVKDYLPKEAYTYLESVYTWWADYTLFNKTKVRKTWSELEALVPTTDVIPTLPRFYNTERVLLFQFSGDKFTAEGVYANIEKIRLSELDLNKWVNKNIPIEKIFGGSGTITIPPVEVKSVVETFKKSIKFVNVLNVPYISQLGEGAQKHGNDCGAGCGCMTIGGYKDIIPTVDEFYDKAQASGDVYLSATQIINVLKGYGVPSAWKISDIKNLMSTLSSGKPVICLILYKTLVDAGIVHSTFKGYHFVLATGYDTKNIYINDPLAGGEFLEVPIETFNQCWKDAGVDPNANPSYGCIVPNNPIGGDVISYPKYKVTANSLYIRSGPGTSYSATGSLKYGDIVEVLNISNGWAKLATQAGYCSAQYLMKI